MASLHFLVFCAEQLVHTSHASSINQLGSLARDWAIGNTFNYVKDSGLQLSLYFSVLLQTIPQGSGNTKSNVRCC